MIFVIAQQSASVSLATCICETANKSSSYELNETYSFPASVPLFITPLRVRRSVPDVRSANKRTNLMLDSTLMQSEREMVGKINSKMFILFIKWNNAALELSHFHCCVSCVVRSYVDCSSDVELE
jgi:hypothetical protein